MKRIYRDFIIPIVVALIVGGASSFLTAQVVLANHEVRIGALEDDLKDTKRNVDKIVESVGEMKNLQVQLLTNQKTLIQNINKLESTVTSKFDQYDQNIRQFYLNYGHILNPDGR